MELTSTNERRADSPWLWAIYLASSWLWCIGMFFPVLLYRDYGHGSWVLFTIPNVLGAASMPWFLRTRAASAAFVQKYARACQAFSWVTASFQAFFIGWVSQFIPAPLWAIGAVLGAVVAVTALVGGRASLIASAVVWLGSMALMVYVLGVADAQTLGFPDSLELLRMKADGFWLTPIFLVGFAFCPYLDLTFHRARQATEGRQAKAVFLAGFSIPFLLGLVFTLIYSHPMAEVLAGNAPNVPGQLVVAVCFHLVLQASFTFAEHFRSALEARRPQWIHLPWALGLVALGAWMPSGGLLGMTYSELGYRSFLVCYGLLAPTFIWVVLVSNRSKSEEATGPFGLSPRVARIGIVAAALALPFYAAAFLGQGHGLTWLALPGASIMLAIGLLAYRPQTLAMPAAAKD